MQESTRWFRWTVVLLALHMSEQLMFGIGELAALNSGAQDPIGARFGWRCFRRPRGRSRRCRCNGAHYASVPDGGAPGHLPGLMYVSMNFCRSSA